MIRLCYGIRYITMIYDEMQTHLQCFTLRKFNTLLAKYSHLISIILVSINICLHNDQITYYLERPAVAQLNLLDAYIIKEKKMINKTFRVPFCSLFYSFPVYTTKNSSFQFASDNAINDYNMCYDNNNFNYYLPL